MMESALFFGSLFIVALLYASVGHGGASGYLALMALFGVAPEVMKPTALLLNLFVALVAFIQFYRGGHFQWRLFLPFALASVPMSFAGGWIAIDAAIYKKILGVLLLVPIARFLWNGEESEGNIRPHQPAVATGIGAGIGFISGLIGIGGGILLSPIVLLLRWAHQKQAAAISSLFIFVNSLAGLAGQWAKGVTLSPSMWGMVAAALGGGLAGAYLGAHRFHARGLQYILAAVLALAAGKLLFLKA